LLVCLRKRVCLFWSTVDVVLPNTIVMMMIVVVVRVEGRADDSGFVKQSNRNEPRS
jgi:hypothetical protein